MVCAHQVGRLGCCPVTNLIRQRQVAILPALWQNDCVQTAWHR